MSRRVLGICANCNDERLMQARGLCTRCYQYEMMNGIPRPTSLPDKVELNLDEQIAGWERWRDEHAALQQLVFVVDGDSVKMIKLAEPLETLPARLPESCPSARQSLRCLLPTP